MTDLAMPDYSNTTEKYEGCLQHHYNYTVAALQGYNATMADVSTVTISKTPMECPSRDFNLAQYKSTVVTEVRRFWINIKVYVVFLSCISVG